MSLSEDSFHKGRTPLVSIVGSLDKPSNSESGQCFLPFALIALDRCTSILPQCWQKLGEAVYLAIEISISSFDQQIRRKFSENSVKT